MNYFLLEQLDYIKIEKRKVTETDEATICEVEEVTSFKEVDFIGEEAVISDRFKLLLESYFPKIIWKAYVWIDREKTEQEVFWYLNIPEYQPYKVEVSEIGIVSGIQLDVRKAPRMFQIEQKNGKKCSIVHLSIAESMIRRGIQGVQLIPLSSDNVE